MSAAFHEVQFPPAISYGATGGPTFHTTVLTLASGFEKRNIDWQKARLTYDVSQGVKTQQELNVLLKFFYARFGKAYGFRFKDWSDYQLPFPGDPLPVQMTTDGTTSSFQIVKPYGDATASYNRPIRKPVANTVQLIANGITYSTGFLVDLTTGIVTLPQQIVTTTGQSIAISCQFDVPVRFDTDDMKVSIDDYNSYTWGQIPLVELRNTDI